MSCNLNVHKQDRDPCPQNCCLPSGTVAPGQSATFDLLRLTRGCQALCHLVMGLTRKIRTN